MYEINRLVFNAVAFSPKYLDAQALVQWFNGGHSVAPK
jgi:hypothetical protein